MRTRGFTLIELLVVLGIIAVLAAIIFPVLARSRQKGRQTNCGMNERQITLAVLQYTQDNNECFTWSNSADSANHWSLNISSYIRTKWQEDDAILHCPETGATHQTYSTNTQVIGL